MTEVQKKTERQHFQHSLHYSKEDVQRLQAFLHQVWLIRMVVIMELRSSFKTSLSAIMKSDTALKTSDQIV